MHTPDHDSIKYNSPNDRQIRSYEKGNSEVCCNAMKLKIMLSEVSQKEEAS